MLSLPPLALAALTRALQVALRLDWVAQAGT